MCRWLKEVIVDTDSLSGTVRDVRPVGASTAVQANMDIKRVMEAANWQRLSTLQAEALLQAAEPSVVDGYFKCYQLGFGYLCC